MIDLRPWIDRLAEAVASRALAAPGAFQDPQTGLFEEATHHPIHTTAHCVGALELFDARPEHPLHSLASLEEKDPPE